MLTALNNALAKLKTYRVEVPEESRVIEVVLPDRFRQPGFDFLVKIGPTLYRFDPRGQKLVSPVGALPFFDRANLVWFRDQFTQVKQVIFLGPGKVDDIPCIGYSTTLPGTIVSPPKTPGAPSETTQVAQPVKIWFDTKDGFPLLIELGNPEPLHIYYYDFNNAIEINPP